LSASGRSEPKPLENPHCPGQADKQKGVMSPHPTESERLLSQIIAEWACSLKYKLVSPAAIQAAKLFWFDSIGCALGGSQQDDARILLKHYRAMSGGNGGAAAFAGPVFVTTGHGDVLIRPAPPESDVLNLPLR